MTIRAHDIALRHLRQHNLSPPLLVGATKIELLVSSHMIEVHHVVRETLIAVCTWLFLRTLDGLSDLALDSLRLGEVVPPVLLVVFSDVLGVAFPTGVIHPVLLCSVLRELQKPLLLPAP